MTNNNYQLPIERHWHTQDIIKVSKLVDDVLSVYETSMLRSDLLTAYRDFCDVIPSKGEQRKFDRDFEQQTGYSIYRTIQTAKASSKDRIRLGL